MKAQSSTPSSTPKSSRKSILRLGDLQLKHAPQVGIKSASLGEIMRHLTPEGIRVPDGFVISVAAYEQFLRHNKIPAAIDREWADWDQAGGEKSLAQISRRIRRLILAGTYPPALEDAIITAYHDLSAEKNGGDVAVRSSASAEDLPEASFAGQQESFLHVSDAETLLDACKRCFASTYTERSLSYREQKGCQHAKMSLSICVQNMVRADLGVSGVIFTLDTETGFPGVIVINAAYGLGQAIVQGEVNPDEYRVFKPALENSSLSPILERVLGQKEVRMVYSDQPASSIRSRRTPKELRRQFALSDSQVLELARWARKVEKHFGHAVDIEFAIDGETNQAYLLQARPETVHSQRNPHHFVSCRLQSPAPKCIVSGRAIGSSIVAGTAGLLHHPDEADQFSLGQILVVRQTGPEWVPLMRKAAGIVTDHGGRTSHAAIVSRELGIPAVIGTGLATHRIREGQDLTLDCARGEVGSVHRGILPFQSEQIDLDGIPAPHTRVLLNAASPESGFHWWQLPADGIGFASTISLFQGRLHVHPLAILKSDQLDDSGLQDRITRLARLYDSPEACCLDQLAMGMASLAASRYPLPVHLFLSDQRPDAYAQLTGGSGFEPAEQNPLLGLQGAARILHPEFRPFFETECRALRNAREEFGLHNLIPVFPVCRTPAEADQVLKIAKQCGLVRGKKGLEIATSVSLPSQTYQLRPLAERFDHLILDLPNLHQLLLGIDSGSPLGSEGYPLSHPAILQAVGHCIEQGHEAGAKMGIFGLDDGHDPSLLDLLVRHRIDWISVEPDHLISSKHDLAELESQLTLWP